jgi:hypothetical protein
VVEQAAAVRLVTLDGDRPEMTHEALIQSWPRLRRWLTQDRERLLLHRRLTEAADAWDLLHRDPGALYRGIRLAAARSLADSPDMGLTAKERAFLDASVAAEADEALPGLHRDSPFVILDEPTASLDPQAEADLFGRIRTLFAGRTVLVISRRFSNVRSADRIYVLVAPAGFPRRAAVPASPLRGGRSRGGGGRGRSGSGAGDAQAQVLDVVERLVEEFGDVVVVQGVDDGAALAGTGDQTEGAQDPELVGAGGLFHADGGGQFGGRAGAFAQPGEDQQPGGGGQGLEGLGDLRCVLRGQPGARHRSAALGGCCSVAHGPILRK